MLFFRTPNIILEWFERPIALYMQDFQTAYGYPREALGSLLGREVPEAINVGLYALNGAVINWDKLEAWVRELQETYGPTYFQEQALTALLLAAL